MIEAPGHQHPSSQAEAPAGQTDGGIAKQHGAQHRKWCHQQQKKERGPVAVSTFERDAKTDGPKGIEHKVKDPPVQESRGEKSPGLGPDGVMRNTVDRQEADRRVLISKLPQRGQTTDQKDGVSWRGFHRLAS